MYIKLEFILFQVEIEVNVTHDVVKYFPSGEVTVDTERLGPIEFKRGQFRQDFYGRLLRLAAYKDLPSGRTGAVWRFFSMAYKVSIHISGVVQFYKFLKVFFEFKKFFILKNNHSGEKELRISAAFTKQ